MISIEADLSARVIGQPDAIARIAPWVEMFQAGLSPEGRPAGVFLLLGPSGTGKTHTVESLAEAVHGSRKHVLRVDCGEFQMEHEVAKLIGAPPGYLGHRETHPVLTQHKLSMATSERSRLSIVLFDEIEKAAPSMVRLLLGVLDKATLKLGDNTTVNFENSLIFLTSNLGARSIVQASGGQGHIGFASPAKEHARREMRQAAESAARKHFSPEFLNRIDDMICYAPLDEEMVRRILQIHLHELDLHLLARLGPKRAISLDVTPAAKRWLVERGVSREYGARELRRTIHRSIVNPLSRMLNREQIGTRGTVRVEVASGDLRLSASA